MINKEKTDDFIRRAYQTACDHGFHDEEKSNAHWMMLVLSEIGEMVEADRKNRHADIARYEHDGEDTEAFEEHIKSSLEDETADVCIRLFDFFGMKGAEPELFYDGKGDWERLFSKMSVCEQCYELVQGATMIYNESGLDEISEIGGSLVRFCFDFAEWHGFDLEWHIKEKMKYNESRARMHGKRY